MPPRVNVETLFRRYLGKETADGLLAKIDKMVAQKKSAAKIESAIETEIEKLLKDGIADKIKSTIGRRYPVPEPVDVWVGSRIKPISICRKLETGVHVRMAGKRVSIGRKS